MNPLIGILRKILGCLLRARETSVILLLDGWGRSRVSRLAMEGLSMFYSTGKSSTSDQWLPVMVPTPLSFQQSEMTHGTQKHRAA